MVKDMYSYVFHLISLSVYRFVSEEWLAKSRGFSIMSSLYLQNVKISVDIEDWLKERVNWYTVHGINESTHTYLWAEVQRQGYWGSQRIGILHSILSIRYRGLFQCKLKRLECYANHFRPSMTKVKEERRFALTRMVRFTVKVKDSCNRPGVVQRVPGGDIRHAKVVRLSSSRTGRLYPQECYWYSFSLGAESTPGPRNGPGGVTEKSSYTTGNRSRDRPTSSAAP
jgi:hypothetical protein